MRYSIMLQLVTATTVVLLIAAAIFAWMQNRPRLKEAHSPQANALLTQKVDL
jgi:hypothetical protein